MAKFRADVFKEKAEEESSVHAEEINSLLVLQGVQLNKSEKYAQCLTNLEKAKQIKRPPFIKVHIFKKQQKIPLQYQN